MLSAKGLYLNASKTVFDIKSVHADTENDVDEMRVSLLRSESNFATASGEEDKEEDDDAQMGVLSEEQVEYLLEVLRTQDIDDELAEVVLTLMRDHGDDVLSYMETFLTEFPNLSKSVYHFCAHILDAEGLARCVLNFVRKAKLASDFQLFWLAKLAEDRLGKTVLYGDILHAILTHARASAVVKAKILEIPEMRFGFPEVREEYLRDGSSHWPSWAAAIGTRGVPCARRNHVLKYFRAGSRVNRTVAETVAALPKV